MLADQQGTPGAGYLAQLLALQNGDGGFGTAAGHSSNPVDTAWALMALVPDQPTTPAAQDAIHWLLNAQNGDGNWPVTANEDGTVPTALAVQALQHYRTYSGVAAAQARARGWLAAQKRADQGWGRADHTAQALLALLPGQTDATAHVGTVAHLESGQTASGSWLGDPYATALVLRALWLAQQPAPNPEMASVSGLVFAEDTGQPVPGVTVSLQANARSAVTDAQGRFAFHQINAGSEQLNIRVAGYLDLTAQLTIQKGAAVDLGVLRLKPGTGAGAATVTVTGIARFTDDGVNHHPAGNASIRIGALTVQTDTGGQYVLAGVAPGAINLQATYAGYRPVDTHFAAQAGQLVHFDPLFVRASAQNTLRVRVTEQGTGKPVDSAQVVLNGIVRNADAAGEVRYAVGIAAGTNTVTVHAPGYNTRIITMDIQGLQDILLPVALTPASAAPGQTSLGGIVTDATGGLPLQGAIVRVSGTGDSTTTDAHGRYAISSPHLSGTKEIMVEHAGYQAHVQAIAFTPGRAHAFDLALQARASAAQAAHILLAITDRASARPVPNATVTLSGSNSHAMQTDAAGQAQISGMHAGPTQIQVSAPGYDDAVFSVDVQRGINYRVPVALTPRIAGKDRIHGRVFDVVGRQPIPGATVTLVGHTVLQTVADSRGRYEFPDITPGRWNLSATAAGYAGSSRGYDVSASSQIDIALRQGGGTTAGTGTLRAVAAGHPNLSNRAVGYLFIFGPHGTQGSVTSNNGGVNNAFTIDASGVAEIMVPSSQFLNQSGQALDQALLVHASNPVSAYFLNREEYSTDMTYLLDAAALGTRYRILDWPYVVWGREIQMSFTALEDGTTVRITPSAALNPGKPTNTPFEVQVNKGQSYLYTVYNGSEMSGTTVESDKPIAVFAGEQCANIPAGSGYCDHLFTQLPPVEHWASEYVIPMSDNTGSAGNLVRIISDRDGNSISINGAAVAVLDAGEFYEHDPAQDLHIQSSFPVLAGQFLKGSVVTTGGDWATRRLPMCPVFTKPCAAMPSPRRPIWWPISKTMSMLPLQVPHWLHCG